MKSLKILLPAILLLIISSSCDKLDDFNLSGTIFIEDPVSYTHLTLPTIYSV